MTNLCMDTEQSHPLRIPVQTIHRPGSDMPLIASVSQWAITRLWFPQEPGLHCSAIVERLRLP